MIEPRSTQRARSRLFMVQSKYLSLRDLGGLRGENVFGLYSPGAQPGFWIELHGFKKIINTHFAHWVLPWAAVQSSKPFPLFLKKLLFHRMENISGLSFSSALRPSFKLCSLLNSP